MRARTLVFLFAACIICAGAAVAAADTPPAAVSAVYLPHVANNTCGSFFDGFDDPASGWYTTSGNGLLAEYRDGEYRMVVRDRGMVWFLAAPEQACDRREYRAAIDARWEGETANFYGLMFDVENEGERGYLLAVNTDRRVYFIARVTDSGLEFLTGPNVEFAVRPGNEVNRLAVQRRGDTVSVAINDIPIIDMPIAAPGVPVASGLVVATYTTRDGADARFDNFVYE